MFDEFRLEVEVEVSSLSITNLFGLLGFVIGTVSQRGVRSTAVVLCLVVGLIYWLAYIGANALALSGWILPWMGVWAPNFIFGALGAWLFIRQSSLR